MTTATTAPAMTVCLAWITMTGVEATGRYRDRYGFEPETRATPEAKACVWVMEGTPADLSNARAYAETFGYVAMLVAADERDPLNVARNRAMSMFRKGQLQVAK